MPFDDQQRELLLRIARRSIEHGLSAGELAALEGQDFPATLREPRSSFVTLMVEESLRGCCGTLEAPHPLIVDVWNNAYRSAFGDPRFNAIDEAELEVMTIEISVLDRLEPIAVSSEAELLAKLEPGRDGLLLRYRLHEATFLPVVWQTLPHKRAFVRQLKVKAGLAEDFWCSEVACFRYHTESFGATGREDM